MGGGVVIGAPTEERMGGIWGKQSGGDPSRERGSKEWRQSISSQTLPKQRPPKAHVLPGMPGAEW